MGLFDYGLNSILRLWIGLDVVNNLIIACHKIRDRDPTSVGTELAQLNRAHVSMMSPVHMIAPAGKIREIRHALVDVGPCLLFP